VRYNFVRKVVLALILAFSVSHTSTPRAKLVVFIVVDMMREDTFDRLGDLFSGGFKYLQESGTYFSEARHGIAYTVTGPGHFILGSGRNPSASGIVGNFWYDRSAKEQVYCVTDPETKLVGNGKSPEGRKVSYRYVNSDALGDWVKSANGQSKVFAVAGKDRSAILLGGKNPDGVYWFNFDQGEFISSDYYGAALPAWLNEFNRQRHPAAYFGTEWNRLLADEAVYLKHSREDDFAPERDKNGGGDTTFPHRLPKAKEFIKPDYNQLWSFPWLDEVTLNLARTIVEEEELGMDEAPDILCVGLSINDGVGHRYGPFSQEQMDGFLRMDGWLGEFFDAIDHRVGLDNTLIVLTADHGATMMPEMAQDRGLDAGRFRKQYKNFVADFNAALSRKWGDGDYIEAVAGSAIYYNYDLLKQKGISLQEMDSSLLPLLRDQVWLGKVYSRAQLAGDEALDQAGLFWRNNFHSENSGDLFLVPTENYIHMDSTGTTHGTAHDCDTHIPLIIAGSGIKKTMRQDPVWTVDVAPTVAAYLGISTPDDLDGSDLGLRSSVDSVTTH